jgi:hypothetical protein
MTRHLVPVFGLALGLLVAAPAHAQNLGTKGDAIFAAERLFGVRGEHWKYELPAPAQTLEVTDTIIAFGFATTRVPYNIPRLAFDYMVIDKLSIGGSLGFVLADATTTNAATDLPATTFLIQPRIGYLHMFGRVAGIWPRGGLYYHSAKIENQFKESGFGLNAEAMFPIVMAGHFGMEIGIAFDQSLGASRDPENGVSYDVSYRSIGLQVNLFGWI